MTFDDAGIYCPNCGTRNAFENTRCSQCDQALAISSRVLDRQKQQGLPEPIDEMRRRAGSIKSQASMASAERMNRFETIDKRRRSFTEKMEREARQRGKRILQLALAGFGLFLLILLAAALMRVF